ncbi:MAG: hypothetical protein Q4E70_00965 [Candidatus Saccharibacteria bacterium]|nr:hypothetical protein [Candidatus Saccharibacteria bacterium]
MDNQQPVQPMQPSSDFLNRMDMANGINVEPEKPRKKLSLPIIIGIIVGVVAIVGGIVAVVMISSNSNVQPTVTATTTYPDEPEEDELSEEIIQRNTLRANDLAPLLTALNNYQANNRGELPGDWAGMIRTYIPEGLKDSATGEAYVIADFCNFSESNKCNVNIDELTWEENQHEIYVFLNAACKGNTKEDVIVSHTGKKKAAMFAILEGSKNFLCVNN